MAANVQHEAVERRARPNPIVADRLDGGRAMKKHLKRLGIAAGAGALIAGFATGPAVFAADHLDAPGLTSPSARPDADINDVYAFNSSKAGRSVLAMTTGPGAGAIAPLTYATDVDYKINIDQNGDAVEDLAYTVRFGQNKAKSGTPRQDFTVRQFSGARAISLTGGKVVARGVTNTPQAAVTGGGLAWAGLRSDPFFFDLDAFRQVVLKQDRGRTGFCDKSGQGVDFFAMLNTNIVILDLPNSIIGGKIGVWAQTVRSNDKVVIDQMGRPAINTVFNKGEDKNIFNATVPSQQVTMFAKNVSDTLTTFSGLDKEGAYGADVVGALTKVLIPDTITFDTATKAAGPLNGRAPADDVIDAELNIVTGGYQVPGRDAAGAIPSDCVAAHTDYTAAFPYFGKPHGG
jgi:hypothetical protein